MDFGFTEEQEKLRNEVHDFYVNELPADYEGDFFGPRAISEECAIFSKELQRKAGQKGWLGAGWPKEYGGLGLGAIAQGIINEEQGYWGVGWPNYTGIGLAGPALLLFGTEEQKKRFLPPIARGEGVWDQLFTEPDAGSDEANIQLRAVADGDDFVFNGQKMFVGELYKPDYLYTEARTADTTPKHRGLTLFLIPADTPGITFRPLPCMNGQQKNEVFFDDVRVSREYMLGEFNRGFYHAMTTLTFERSNTGMAAGLKRQLEEFVQFCKETKRNGKPLIEDPQVRDTLAKIAVQVEVVRLAGWYTAWRHSEREKLGPAPYDLAGFYRRIWADEHCKVMIDMFGLYGQLRPGSKWAPLMGALEHRWQATRSIHQGGTTEILKVVLAERGLDLPRRR